jgi:hypothetical protein
MSVWRTTVTEVVLILRDALRALVPHVTRAGIEWRENAAYDDWDEIAQLLFEKIVVASVIWALPEVDRSPIDFAAYDVMYDSYAGKAVIVVKTANAERLVFHSFGTRDQPFDIVRTRLVDKEGGIHGNDFVIVAADTATYRVQTPATTIDDLLVEV